MGRFFLEKILPYFIAPIIWLYSRTWRIYEFGPASILEKHVSANRQACIYAHWHGDELVLIPYYSYKNLAVLSSLSKDGSIMARSLELLGYHVLRGSSSRGGARGLIGLIRAVRNEGHQAALAVDGPKGPIYEVKPGVVELAIRTEVPIIPLRTFTDRAWFIPRTWNKCYVPKPFAKVFVVYSEPVPANNTSDHAVVCAHVKRALDSIQDPQKKIP